MLAYGQDPGRTERPSADKAFMNKSFTRQMIHSLILLIGLVLMIGGIITGKQGATVTGLIVAAVNIQQWIQWKKIKDES